MLSERQGLTDKPQRFRVIKGGPAGDGEAKPRAYRAKAKGETELLVCYICEQDIGVATTLTFEARHSRMAVDGIPEGGEVGIYCLTCLARGKTTKLI